MAFTTEIDVNGDVQLSAALESAGYRLFNSVLQGEIQFLNLSATPCYLNFTQNGYAAPADQTKGMPFCTDSAVAPSPGFVVSRGCELPTTWLYAASAVTIKIAII